MTQPQKRRSLQPTPGSLVRPVEPLLELGAYEALWAQKGATFKRIADFFAERPGALPSDLVPSNVAEAAAQEVLDEFTAAGLDSFGVLINQTYDYPVRLRAARHPIELLYYQGDLSRLTEKSIAVVGTRSPSPEGRQRAEKLTSCLVAAGFTIVSGLAAGIDTVAHRKAIEEGGSTIAVLGTPIHRTYPPENRELQEYIAEKHLIVSQVPVIAYRQMPFKQRRTLFPARNVTMSAITAGTVIVEAGETSGTLIQARAALAQGRRLFILENCFQNKNITWPERYLAKGATRVKTFEDIEESLSEATEN